MGEKYVQMFRSLAVECVLEYQERFPGLPDETPPEFSEEATLELRFPCFIEALMEVCNDLIGEFLQTKNAQWFGY